MSEYCEKEEICNEEEYNKKVEYIKKNKTCKDNVIFFYEGLPYYDIDVDIENDGYIYANNYWTREVIHIKISKIEEFIKKEDIERIYLEKCKKEIEKSIIGWTVEDAKKLENKGQEYILNTLNKYLNKCPSDVYNASKKGKYGIMTYVNKILCLPCYLQIKDRMCSDGKNRKNDEYIKFILQDNFDILDICSKKWPMFKFICEIPKHKTDDILSGELYCILPFYDNPYIIDDIHNKVLL